MGALSGEHEWIILGEHDNVLDRFNVLKLNTIPTSLNMMIFAYSKAR